MVKCVKSIIKIKISTFRRYDRNSSIRFAHLRIPD